MAFSDFFEKFQILTSYFKVPYSYILDFFFPFYEGGRVRHLVSISPHTLKSELPDW